MKRKHAKIEGMVLMRSMCMVALVLFIFLLTACKSGAPINPDFYIEASPSSMPTDNPVDFAIETSPSGIPADNSVNTGGSASEVSTSYNNMGARQIGFGYADASGTKLIVLADSDIADNRLLTGFEYAFGENGRLYRIKYSCYQDQNDNGNGRQNAGNFENESGCIYMFLDDIATPDDTFILFGKRLSEELQIYSKQKNPNLSLFSREIMEKCAAAANRKIENGWLLAEYQDGFRLYFLEFESKDEMLQAWLVLENDFSFRHYEYTASDDKENEWFYGEGGVFSANRIHVLCTVQVQQDVFAYLIWYSSEGQHIEEIKFSGDGAPAAKIVSGRYTG